MYVQIYDVRTNAFVLRTTHIYPLASGSHVSAVYATDRRVFVGLAVPAPPAALATGQLLVFERLSAITMVAVPVVPSALAGVPTVIRAVDDADGLVVTAGYVPHATKPTGFIQSVQWRNNRYEPYGALLRSVPVTDVSLYSVLRGLTRLHLVFVAQTQGLAVLQLDELNGAIAQYNITLPIPASKLDLHADQLAVIGFDTTRRVTVSSVYQWSVDRLVLRRTITHTNRAGGIIGVVFNRLNLMFADTAWLRFSR
jgi:hypothetical protein